MACRRIAVLFFVLGFAGLLHGDVKRSSALPRMQADLKYLASDECEGRGPDTNGINKAADFIAAAFKDAGLKGAMPDGSYYQPFSVKGSSRLAKSELAIQTPKAFLKLAADDFLPLGASGTGKVGSELVFVGHSVVSENVGYDDYKGLNVEGKIVVMLRRCPRYSSEQKFGESGEITKASSILTKLAIAEKHKAAGVILVNDRTLLAETGDSLTPFSATSSASALKIPCVHLRRDLAQPLFRWAFGKSIEQIEEAVDKDLQPRNGPMKDCSAYLDVVVERDRRVSVKNVVGVLEGKGPLANETLIVGAHYDHLGYGGAGSFVRDKAIHHGADDNASGTATIIEMARRFGAMKDRAGRRILFMTFSCEEMGLIGSAHYCKEPIFPLESTFAMINLDMVGRMVADKETNFDKLEIGGVGTAKQFEEMVDKHSAKYKLKVKKTAAGMGPSDHQSFFLKELPVLFFFTGLHADYHRPSDTWDKINYAGMVKIADLCEDVTADLAARDGQLDFVKVKGSLFPSTQDPHATTSSSSTVRMTVRTGLMMDYNDETEGVLVTGTSPGSPAAKAGFKEGDRMVEFAGQPIKNVTAYTAVLQKCEGGKEVEAVILRDGKKVTLKVTPEAAKPRE